MRVILLAVFAAAALLADPSIKWKVSLGTNDRDRIVAATTDRDGNILVTGETVSRAFPATGLQKRPGGSTLLRDGQVQDIPLDGEVFKIVTDRRAPSKLFAATELGLMKSADSASSWQVIYSGRVDDFVIDLDNSNIVYRAAGDVVMKSEDGGGSWRKVGPAVDASTPGHAFLQLDPLRPGTIYWNGSWKSADGGLTWKALDTYLGHFIFDPYRKDLLYRADFDAVEQSADGGQNWTNIDSRIPFDGLSRYVTADPLHPGVLYSIKIQECGQLAIRRGDECRKSALYRREGYGGRWFPVELPGFFTAVWFQPGITAVYMYNGFSIIRSIDGFETWQGFQRMHRRRVHTLAFNASGQALVGIGNSADVFVAKLDPGGRLLWSTYLGGDNNDVPTAIVAGSDGSVYITGVTYSQKFLGNSIAEDQSAWFVARLAQDGSRLIYSRILTESGSIAASIAVDSSGSAYMAGVTTGDLPVTPGALQQQFRTNYRPIEVSARTNAFALKLNATGSDIVYATYLGVEGDAASSIALDEDGSAYVSGTAVWKLSSSGGGLDFYYPMRAAYVSSAFLDSRRNLTGVVQTFDDNFERTGGLVPVRPGVVKHFLIKLAPDQRRLLSSVLLFDDGSFDAGSVLATPGGPIVAGTTTSLGLPTRGILRGPSADGGGFITALNPEVTALRYSTYLDGRIVGATAANDGNPILIGLPATVMKVEDVEGSAIRIDRVLNAASRESTALASGMKVMVETAGISGLAPTVYVNGSRVPVLSVANSRITFEAPLTRGDAVLRIEAGGSISRETPLTAAPSSPAFYSRDADGIGQAWAFNENGEVNSAKRPALPGSVVTVAANGLKPNGLPRVWVNGEPANVVNFERKAFEGLPGVNDLIEIQLPQPLESGRVQLRIGDDSVLYPPAARVYVNVD